MVSSNDHPNDGTFTFTSGGPDRVIALGKGREKHAGQPPIGICLAASGATAREAMAHRPEPVKHGRVLIFPTMVAYYVQFLASSHSLISGAGRGLAK